MHTPCYVECYFMIFSEPLNMQIWEVFVFANFIAIFAFWTIRNFSFSSEFRELPTLDSRENIYSSAKQLNPFGLPSILINFIENHSCESAARHVEDRTTLFLLAFLLKKNHFRPRKAMAWVTSSFATTAPKTAFSSINPFARNPTAFGRVTSSVTSISATSLVLDIGPGA